MNSLDYIIMAVYIVGFLALGFLFKQSKDSKDYFLGGRSFGWFPLAMSTAATQLSAISFISAPAFVGMKEGGGMVWLTYEFAVPLAMLFLMGVLIPPLYRSGIVSVYAYLEKRFGPTARILLSIVFQVSRAGATAIMIYAIALVLSAVLGFPMWQTILVIGVVTLIYSFQGGMKAVVYGDMIQMIILLVGIVICFFFALGEMGGWGNFLAHVDTDRLTAVDFTSFGTEGDEFGFWPMLIGGFFLYTSYYGTDQSQVQRLLSASSEKTLRQTLLCNGLMRFPITLAYCVMGLVVGTYAFSQTGFLDQIPDGRPDYMIPIFIKDYLPNGVKGILVVAIFSAAMSSLSSAINSLSAATVEDFFNRGKNKIAEKDYMKYSYAAALFWGVFCIVLAFFVGNISDTVIEAINKIGSLFYGPILATFLAAILIKRINGVGANVGLVTGVLFNIYLWKFVPEIFWFWWNFIGLAITLTVALVVSSLVKKGAREEETLSIGKVEISPRYALILVVFFGLIVAFSVALPSFF